MHLGHTLVSSLVHGLIYGVIFKLFHNSSLLLAMMIAVLAIGVLWSAFGRRK